MKKKSFTATVGRVKENCYRVYIPASVKKTLRLKAGNKVRVTMSKV